MIVMKFGGTSVGGAEEIKNVAEIVKSKLNENPVVVVSAVKGITDKLIELANLAIKGEGEGILDDIKSTHMRILDELKINKNLLAEDFGRLENVVDNFDGKELDAKALDLFQSFGEQMSSKILSVQLDSTGVKSRAFDSWELGLVTSEDFGNAEPLDKAYAALNKSIQKLTLVPVITGFIGKTEKGEVTTLSRGGSDYTAAIIGSSIDAEEIQIWTDVDGIMSADPKIVSGAKLVEKVSFAEASELAFFGAKVLHPKTILPAVRKNIPVRVLNTFNPNGNGTLILKTVGETNDIVKAITGRKNITVININSTRMFAAYGFLAKLFAIFDRYKKNVDVISTSEVNVSVTINEDNNLDNMLDDLREIADIEVKKHKAIICVVEEGIKHNPSVVARTFVVLGKNNINIEMISQGASEINITLIVDDKNMDRAIRLLHQEHYGV